MSTNATRSCPHHHGDAGGQDIAQRFTDPLAQEASPPSIGSVGDAYDNV